MIIISEPKISKNGKKVRLYCQVEYNEEIKTIWVEVEDKYSRFFVKDRCDAFLIALLPIAMREGKDISCLAPVSEELLYNLRTHLIPTLVKNSKNLYKTRILAEANNHSVKNAGAVGTGMSRGVDSMHVLNECLDSDYPHMRLTHLCINDVGAFDIAGYTEGGRDNSKIKQDCIKESIELAAELDLPYVLIKSNIMREFKTMYALNHIYYNIFPVYALQKLFKIYYYGSYGLPYSEFSLKDCDRHECGAYELLLTSVFSTSTLKIIPEGAEKNFLEKVEDIVHFAPAHKHLHVCITGSKNCNKCVKCMRTMLAIDSVDKLDNFSQVFDVDYYRKNKKRYFAYLDKCHTSGNKIMESVYEQFNNRKMLSISAPTVLNNNITIPENINTSALIVKNLTDGSVLIKKQVKESFSTVATSKILTAIIALESGKTQMVIELPEGVIKGVSRATVYDLINVLLITQNNLVSDIIAETVSGSVKDFIALMNSAAKKLRAINTYFSDTTGLGAENRTTVEDTAKIVEYALKNKHFCQIFKRKNYTIKYDENEIPINTLNPLLREKGKLYIPECVGMKYGLYGTMGNVIAVLQQDVNLYLMILMGIKEGVKTQHRYLDTYNLANSVIKKPDTNNTSEDSQT